MAFDRKQDLPEEVRDIIFSEEIYQANDSLFQKFHLDRKQIEFILNLLDAVYLQRIEPLELPQKLEEISRAEYISLRDLAMDIATSILWPLQDHLGSVDRLILRLGGKIPKLKPIRKRVFQKKIFPGQATGTIEKITEEYDDFKTLRLSSRKIIDKDGKAVSPTVDNWLKDYVHFLGAGFHNALDRAKYLAKSPNVLPLSPAEKESIRYLVIAYDDKVEMDFLLDGALLKVSEPVQSEGQLKNEQAIDVNQIVENFKKKLLSLESSILPEDFILSEAENDPKKVRNILWNALGLQDKEKTTSCLKLLIKRKNLDLMLKEDVRFLNILKRFVNIRYGGKYDGDLDNWLNKNLDKLIVRRLFLEMVLVEKLRLDSQEAMLWAFYLSNLVAGAGQIVYLDEDDGQLKWREVQVNGENISWVDNL
ncbi:hypothetical protein C4566_01755 [Candidatus Parcubacteria bacterium]|nr:MAG: hypothetical protein C4566_01755 [Candidatus Parcubacteria bacterium]